jgi:methionine-rich copper-binding protein CopC
MARHSLHSSRRNPGRRGSTLLAVVLLCLSFGLASAPAASAHDQLVSSTPATGERLSVAPSSVALKFNAPLLSLGHEIRVVDAASKNWVQGDSVLARETLTQPLAPDLPEGEYQVRWRVVSSDGHPINGSYSFLVGPDAQPGSIPATGTTAGPAGGAVQSDAAASGDATSPDGLPGWLGAAGIGAAAGLGLYLAWGLFQRRRRATASGS